LPGQKGGPLRKGKEERGALLSPGKGKGGETFEFTKGERRGRRPFFSQPLLNEEKAVWEEKKGAWLSPSKRKGKGSTISREKR